MGPSLESDRGEMAVRRQRNGAGRERREPARRASPRSKELVDQREVIRVARSARTMGKISSAKYEVRKLMLKSQRALAFAKKSLYSKKPRCAEGRLQNGVGDAGKSTRTRCA